MPPTPEAEDVDAPVEDPAAPDAPPVPSGGRVPWSPLWWFTLPVVVGLLAAILWIGASTVPYLAFSPGSATPVEPLIEIGPSHDGGPGRGGGGGDHGKGGDDDRDGGGRVQAQPADGDLLFLTVSVRQPTAFEALLDVVRDDVQVVPAKPYLGNQSNEENQKLNRALMTDSQDKARKVALERLGYEVRAIPKGAFIEDIDPSFPVAKVMKPGAVVVGADGKPVRNRQDLVDAIAAHKPGQEIRLRIRPLGEDDVEEVVAELGHRPDDPKAAVLGVSLVDEVSYTFPVDIRINTGKVGGPSAGLAFTLAILDRLTPGDLLGDKRVAVTGTIELDGSVGPVGGVQHKARAAIKEGAKLFIVPPDELAEARKAAGDRLVVRPASSLDQALRILRRFGGDPLPASANHPTD